MRILPLLTFMLWSNLCFTQTNIMQTLQVSNSSMWSFAEKGDYYYFLTEEKGNVSSTIMPGMPQQYVLNKYHKFTFQKIDEVTIVGDTVANDTLRISQPILKQRDGNFYVFNTIYRRINGIIDTSYLFTRCDTALQVKAQRVLTEKTGPNFTGATLPLPNGNCVMGHIVSHTFTTFSSRYLLIDSMGNALDSGQLGPNYFSNLRDIKLLPDNKLMVLGRSIAGTMVGSYFSWTVNDLDMNILDTFHQKAGAIQAPWTSAWEHPIKSRYISLPTGSLISARLYQPNDFLYPIIAKHTAASRYGADAYIDFTQPLDTSDHARTNAYAQNAIVYNPFDNNIYFASGTHQNFWVDFCYPDLVDVPTYMEVICVDTNLNFRWKKYIKMEEPCSELGDVIVPDGRSGIIIAGRPYYDINSTLSNWAFYINDTTASEQPTSIKNILTDENNFKIYPNPAYDEVHFNLLQNKLERVQIFDLSGRMVMDKSMSGQKGSIKIGSLVNGIYILKAIAKDGSFYRRKLTKR